MEGRSFFFGAVLSRVNTHSCTNKMRTGSGFEMKVTGKGRKGNCADRWSMVFFTNNAS